MLAAPADHRTEKALLGALLIDGAAVDAVRRVAGVEDFSHAHGRRVYRAMLALRDRGLPVDYATVCSELERDGALERIGAGTLTDVINWAPTSLHALAYARVLAEEGRLRRGEPEPDWTPEPGAEPPQPLLRDRLGLDDDDPVPPAGPDWFDPRASF